MPLYQQDTLNAHIIRKRYRLDPNYTRDEKAHYFFARKRVAWKLIREYDVVANTWGQERKAQVLWKRANLAANKYARRH